MSPFENYLKELRDIRATGAAVAETSFYPALSNLFNEIGKGLKPKVRCVMPIADRGAGLPDGGFFAANQFRPPALTNDFLSHLCQGDGRPVLPVWNPQSTALRQPARKSFFSHRLFS